MRTNDEKYDTVIHKNTFYYFNNDFEDEYEKYITSIKDTLLVLKNKVETEGLTHRVFEDLLLEKENGLRSLLALTGFSNEYLKRLTTIIRITNDAELNRLVNKNGWGLEESDTDIKEWSDKTIEGMIKANDAFRRGLINLFFEGSSVPFLTNTIPLFELKKLSIAKLKFDISELIDTLVRYKEKSSYAGRKENNPEAVVNGLLDTMGITHETGDLAELVENAPDKKRTMDFIIPNKREPVIIAESSYLSTTSSGQGDKGKAEIGVDALLREHYPNAHFVGFVDGIGWYVRKHDLKRMVAAYEDVFTFHPDEIARFKAYIQDARADK